MNVLKVEANTSQLSFWVNNSLLGVVQDKTYARGYLGVCVGNYENAADPTITEATYRNAYVWLI